jgi:F-type H+-transporting ATPase subunit gamma
MPSIKEYNNKIKSLNNTQKITRTMKMVSASKLKKAQEAQTKAKLYAQNISSLISRMSESIDDKTHPLLLPKEQTKKALVLLFTSDKGLCGSFNHNTNKRVTQWIDEQHKNFDQIDLSICGKRGYNFFKSHKEADIREFYEDVTIKPNFEDAVKIGNDLINYYKNDEYDEIYIAYSEFFSPLSQKSLFKKILPIDPESLVEEEDLLKSTEYIFEPKKEELLEFLIPHFIYFRVYFGLLENWAGEHGARMTSMDSATKNASELIDKNTLLRNRARQTAITTELTEIVAGAEALK